MIIDRIIISAALGVMVWVAAVERPKPGFAVPGKVVDVVDGDTLTVEISFQVRVRLLDCWAPEIKGEQKPEGLIAKDKLKSMALGKRCLLAVPTDSAKFLGDVTSLGRVKGHVWVEDDQKSLSDHMVELGVATREKRK